MVANLLDVVVAQGSAIFELLAGEDETLLVGWDAFFVLDLGLDVIDRVRGLNFEGDGLASEGFDEAGEQGGLSAEGIEGLYIRRSLHLHCG